MHSANHTKTLTRIRRFYIVLFTFVFLVSQLFLNIYAIKYLEEVLIEQRLEQNKQMVQIVFDVFKKASEDSDELSGIVQILQDMTQRTYFNSESFVCVIDSNGYIVAHPDSNRVGLYRGAERVKTEHGSRPFVGERGWVEGVWKNRQFSTTEIVSTLYDDETKLTLAAHQNKSLVDERLAQIRFYFVVFSTLILGVLFVIGWVLTRTVLGKFIDQIQGYETELRALNTELEERVEERTNELTSTNVILKQQIQEREQIEEALRAVTAGTAAVTGGDFFRSLVQHLASTLQVRLVFVTECANASRTRLRTLALIEGGEFKENIEYDVAGTACEKVIEGEVCVYPEKLEQLYPKEKGFESYIGVPLLDSGGNLVGHLALLDDKALFEKAYYSSILEIFAARAGAELERKRAQEALQESEERFRSGFAHASIGMAMTAADGHFISVNQAFCGMLGYSEEELLSLTFQEITFPDDLESSVKSFDAVGRGERDSFQLEKRYSRKDGQIVWAITTASVVHDLEGKPWYLFAQIQDITERKRAEETLHRYTKRLEMLQEVDRAILAARSLHEVAYAALERMQQLIRCQYATVVLFDFEAQQTDTVATYPRNKTESRRAERFPLELFEGIDDLREGRTRIVSDFQNRSSTGFIEKLRTAGIRTLISVPLMVKSELIGAFNLGADRPYAFGEEEVQIAREVTNSLAIAIQQARLHDQVQRHATELEERVAERTAELESFAYSISHDLRTPLLAINGFAQLLIEDYLDQLDAEGQRYIKTICDNSKNMGQLIDDLLVFYRIGNQKMLSEEINMAELARQAYESLTVVHTGRKVQLKLNGLQSAVGDRAMIRQVFVNLFSNAIKFTASKGRAVIEAGSKNKEGETVFYVKDNGVGFDMRYADKLFGVFQRLHSEDEFEGTGVGLALVQRIVQRHGGHIWAEAKMNKGATFYFTLQPQRN